MFKSHLCPEGLKLQTDYQKTEQSIRARKSLLTSSKQSVQMLKLHAKEMNEEAQKLFPDKTQAYKSSFADSAESEDEDDPGFLPVDMIYSKEIKTFKQEKKSLKKHISQLLRLLGKDPEENEEYSEGEWESEPRPRSRVKGEKLEPVITVFQPIQEKDDFRLPNAYKTGGLPVPSEEIQSKIRSVGKEMVREIGRKLLNGDFNLTRVSVPIRCMQAATALHNTLKSAILCPPYLAYAGSIQDPVERLKLVVASSMCSFYYLSTFEKPINPVLGETLYAVLEDGSEMFAEQSSHHPPVTHFHIENPLYRLTGYFNFSAKAGLNTVTVTNLGKKVYSFKDGHTISQNCGEDLFGGTFFGTLRHDCQGEYVFKDHNNGNVATVKFGVKNKPTDYFDGSIVDSKGGLISRISGTWIGYMDFDGVRYWDVRHIKPSAIKYGPNLPSDSENRKDLILLRQGHLEEAQMAKEEIENLQRLDRKFREKYHPH